MATYKGDPRWITLKFPGACAKCGAVLPKGSQAFYYPNGRQTLGKACGHGEDASREFDAAASDESGFGF